MTRPAQAILPHRHRDLRSAWALIVAMALLAGGPTRAQSSDAAPEPADTPDAAHSADDLDTTGTHDAPETENGADAGSGARRRMPWVEGVPRADRREARRIFQEGNTLLREGLFAPAVDEYERALALWDHPGFRYNLAIAQINLDQPIAAHDNLKRSRRYGPAPIGEDLYEQAGNLLTLLRNQLARVEVACDQPGAIVTFDGKPVFTAPGRETLLARPGPHQLMADAPGRLPDTRQIVLSPGQHADFMLAPERPAYLATERRWPAWIPWTVTGAGLAIAAGAGVLDWQSSAAFDRYDQSIANLCPNTQGCEPGIVSAELRQQRDRAEAQQWLARAIYLTGGTALATGAVLLYLNRERPVRRRKTIDARSVSVHPVLAPDAAGVHIHFDF